MDRWRGEQRESGRGIHRVCVHTVDVFGCSCIWMVDTYSFNVSASMEPSVDSYVRDRNSDAMPSSIEELDPRGVNRWREVHWCIGNGERERYWKSGNYVLVPSRPRSKRYWAVNIGAFWRNNHSFEGCPHRLVLRRVENCET